MKPKKSKQANLEPRRGMFRQMGIVMALGLTFIAFEYTNADVSSKAIDFQPETTTLEIDYMPITRNKIPLPPPPPPTLLDKIVIDPLNLSIDEIDVISTEMEEVQEVQYSFEEVEEVDPDAIFISPERMPEFPGGMEALMKFLRENVKYPSIAQELGIQGRVYVEFIIDKNGKVGHITLLKGVDKSLDREALRVVGLMPDWKPGYQGGRTVNVSYRLPISFRQQ